MKISFNAIIATLMLVCVSCNNDIFVADTGLEENETVEVEGDGGVATFTIDTKGLERISIDYYGNNNPYKYYNRDGEEISHESPASEVASIVYDGLLRHYELTKDGNTLKFSSLENCTTSGNSILIRMEYSYATRFINILILPGRPLELVSVEYTGDVDIQENVGATTQIKTYNNNVSQPLTIGAMPYLTGYETYTVDGVEDWASYVGVRMPVLYFDNDRWDFKEQEILLGHRYKWSSHEYKKTVDVTIPAYSKVKLTALLYYSTARASGIILFRKPVTGVVLTTPFVCTSTFPVKFDIVIDDVE